MGLISVAVRALLLTAVLLVIATAAIVGREGLQRARRDFRRRLRLTAPYLLALLVILGLNEVARTVGPEVSWAIGWNITGLIYAIEGRSIATIQSIASPPLTAYFSFMYLYGYAFLIVFPFIAYFAAEDPRPLEETAVAYALNYAIGVAAYILFIAYGPRNFMPGVVESILYTTYPQAQLLTREMNVNTNVFPSLHSSLSVTVTLLAWRTRDSYPRWAWIAPVFGASIVVGTMYLGVHWVTDVVAGVGLAVGSVYLASRVPLRRDRTEDEIARIPAD